MLRDANTGESRAVHANEIRLRRAYDEWYFERKYRYSKKERAIRRHYINMLTWANHYTNCDLLNGRDRTALDIGCAYGFVVDLFTKLGYEALGTDISRYAVTRGNELGKGGLFVSDAQYLPFKASTFDLITCFEVLGHLLNPIFALTYIFKLLKKEGTLLITTHVPGVTVTILHILAGMSFSSAHSSVKPLNKWSEILSKLHFTVIRLEPFLLLPVPPTLFNRYFTVKCPSQFASNVKILATKLPVGGKS